jgi:hypothetical protein
MILNGLSVCKALIGRAVMNGNARITRADYRNTINKKREKESKGRTNNKIPLRIKQLAMFCRNFLNSLRLITLCKIMVESLLRKVRPQQCVRLGYT